MPIKGCKETPDSKTGRCGKHPITHKDSTSSMGASGTADAYADVACEICESPADEATMILCGDDYGHGCDRGWHLACMTPALSEVPSGPWFCDDCRNAPEKGKDAQLVDAMVEMSRTRSRTAADVVRRQTYAAEKLMDKHVSSKVSKLYFQ